MKAIVLAAGRGKRFGNKTKLMPKCLIPLGSPDKTLLGRYLDSFREIGIQNVVIVVGHQKNKIKTFCKKNGTGLTIRFIENSAYQRGSIVSLFKAVPEFDDDLLIMDADVYFPTAALEKLILSNKKSVFLIDTRSKSSGEEMMLMAKKGRALGLAKKVNPSLQILGEATGIFKISKTHVPFLAKILKDFIGKKILDVEYEEAYQALMQKIRLGFEKINGHFWTEMDFEEDLKKILSQKSR